VIRLSHFGHHIGQLLHDCESGIYSQKSTSRFLPGGM